MTEPKERRRPVDNQHRWRKKCKAKLENKDQQCPRWAMEGQEVCGKHGGRAPQNKLAGKVHLAELQAQHTLDKMNIEPVDNPLAELAKLAGEMVAWKDLMIKKVATLLAEEWRYEAAAGEQVRAEVILYERAIERTSAILSSMARLNLDERLVKIEEAKGALLAKALADSLTEAEVAEESANLVRIGFSRRLYQLEQPRVQQTY
jgi:hypothetical protein